MAEMRKGIVVAVAALAFGGLLLRGCHGAEGEPTAPASLGSQGSKIKRSSMTPLATPTGVSMACAICVNHSSRAPKQAS